MSKTRENLIGQRFGMLTVVGQGEDYVKPNGAHETKWICQCDCMEHNIVNARGYQLKNGTITSCGCFRKELMSNLKHKINQYDLSGEYGVGWTSNTNQEFYFDLDDYDKIKDYCWYEHIGKNGYHSLVAHDRETKKLIKFHKVLGYTNCDHKDRNPLNNRKNNLRDASVSQNAMNIGIRKNNTSGITGVKFNKRDNVWTAYIQANKKYKYLGSYITKEEAIKVRLQAEEKYYGEFAPQKHLFEQYGIEVNKSGE